MSTTDTEPAPPAAIDTVELVRLRAADPAVHVIDVRTSGEFETGHIEGSYNVPLDLLDEHLDDLAALDHKIVLVCRSGARATQALERLVAARTTNLRLLDGGILAWIASGGHVARTHRRRWAMDRQVRLVAGGAVLGSVVVSLWAPPFRLVAGAIGAGLVFSAVTNTCAMATMLAKLPYNRGASCRMDDVLDRLIAAEANTRPEGRA